MQHILSTSIGRHHFAQVHDTHKKRTIFQRVQKQCIQINWWVFLEFQNQPEDFKKNCLLWVIFSLNWNSIEKSVKNIIWIYNVKCMHSKQRLHFCLYNWRFSTSELCFRKNRHRLNCNAILHPEVLWFISWWCLQSFNWGKKVPYKCWKCKGIICISAR